MLLIGLPREAVVSSNVSSVWNFCARFTDVTSRGIQCSLHEMSAIFEAWVTRTDDVDVIKEKSVIAVDFYDFLLSKRIF